MTSTDPDEPMDMIEAMVGLVTESKGRLERCRRTIERTKRMLDTDIRAAYRHGVGVVRLSQASGYSASRIRQILKEV